MARHGQDRDSGSDAETSGAVVLDAQMLEAMAREELLAFAEALDLRIRRGTATLEDFGELARVREALARREAGA